MPKARPLHAIADEIGEDWKNVYFGAKPYLEAMAELDSINDKYYQDSAKSIVAYFLSNARGWRGPVATRIKKELKDMMSGKLRESKKSTGRSTKARLVNIVAEEIAKAVTKLKTEEEELCEGCGKGEKKRVSEARPKGSKRVSEAKSEVYYVFYNNQKHTFTADTLWDAKKQAIEKLKIPKSKHGVVAVMSKRAYDSEQFRYESKSPRRVSEARTYTNDAERRRVEELAAKIAKMTDRNDHNGSVLELAKFLNRVDMRKVMEHIEAINDLLREMPQGLIQVRREVLESLLKRVASQYGDEARETINRSF